MEPGIEGYMCPCTPATSGPLKSATKGFGVSAFDCSIQVETTCPEAYSVLDRYVLPSLPRTSGAVDLADIHVCVDHSTCEFRLLVNGASVASSDQAINVVPDLIRVLDDAVVKHLTMWRAVHAGVVLWNGMALLLPGVSHAGKSSLVAELLRRGATYFSDEYAVIDKEGCVHPYPRPLLIRNGNPEQRPMLACEYAAHVGDAPARVGLIMALEYAPEYCFSVVPITQGEALLNLLRNTPHVLSESPELVDVFQRAVSGAACYMGRRGDARQAVDEIVRLIDSRSA